MKPGLSMQCTAFEGLRRVASGDVTQVALGIKATVDRGGDEPVLIFDDQTGAQVELDLRGTAEDVAARYPASNADETTGTGDSEVEAATRGPGRPKLGVIGREVTLLPRHWEWLNDQPGGASVALRKLVEQARRANDRKDRTRHSQEAAYRIMSVLGGNLPGFEEASRALFAGDGQKLESEIREWPVDVRAYILRLSEGALGLSQSEA